MNVGLATRLFIRHRRAVARAAAIVPALAAQFLLAVPAKLLAAQTITLAIHISDASGNSIPRAQISIRRVGDSSAALVSGLTDGRGDYNATLSRSSQFLLFVEHTGFKPSGPLTIVISSTNDHTDVVLQVATATLGEVRVPAVVESDCLSLDSPLLSPEVRSWVLLAQNLIQSRRALERRYNYVITEMGTYHDKTGGLRTLRRSLLVTPEDSTRIGENWVGENPLVLPNFGTVMCVGTKLTHVTSRIYELAFKQITGVQPHLEGTLRMTAARQIVQVFVQLVSSQSGYRTGGTTLNYVGISLDGLDYPFIAEIVRSGPAGSSERVSYSSFVRVK